MSKLAIRFSIGLLILAAHGCRCTVPALDVAETDLAFTPEVLALESVYPGQIAAGTVEVTNHGKANASLDVSVDSPFSADTNHIEVAGGGKAKVTVNVASDIPGAFGAILKIGSKNIEAQALVIEVPQCGIAQVCAETHFDLTAGTCVTNQLPENSRCETSCVTDGKCNQGTCVGAFKNCDDNNACTGESCSTADGCRHTPKVCPAPSNPCQVPTCDSLTGCSFKNADDGILCGPDECRALTVDVCLAGSCVTKPRIASARCSNTWAALSVPTRSGHAMAYDSARGRTILFGGGNNDTWEYDGTVWRQLFPVASPSVRTGHAMAYDSKRNRIVLFGGQTQSYPPNPGLSDTWEWDGSTWLQRTPVTSPTSRFGHAMAYDSARNRVVLFGGSTGPDGTWEWDGSSWIQMTSPVSPAQRIGHTMAFDSVRKQVVMFGGNSSPSTNLLTSWLWNGITWVERPGIPVPFGGPHAMAFDSTRERIVLLADFYVSGIGRQKETWEWDGNSWSSIPGNALSAGDGAMVYDSSRRRVVFFAGKRTWEHDGQAWIAKGAPIEPAGGIIAFDIARQRLILTASGNGSSLETWEWDGAAWTKRSPLLSPPGRQGYTMAYDSARQRLVLFGGHDGNFGGHTGTAGLFSDTWEWDGLNWVERTPVTVPPSRFAHGMVYDSIRQKVVLFSGSRGSRESFSGGTWEWDGVNWLQKSADSPRSTSEGCTAAYDPVRQRIVLYVYDAWEWDGATWIQKMPTTVPNGRRGNSHALAYDSISQRVVSFGGFNYPGLGPRSDTWDWDGTTWTQLHPGQSPPPNGGRSMVFDETRQRLTLYDGDALWVYLR